MILRLIKPQRGLQPIYKTFTLNYASQQHPTRYIEVEDHWRRKDDVPRKYKLIYKAPMENILNIATTYLSFSTASVTLLGVYYAAFVYSEVDRDTPVVLGEDIVIANSGIECLSYLGAFILFHAAVKILLAKYVVRLYQDGDNYVAVFRGHMYNAINKHDFKLNEVEKLKSKLAMGWSDSRFLFGRKRAILLEDYFKTPEYYNKLVHKKDVEPTD